MRNKLYKSLLTGLSILLLSVMAWQPAKAQTILFSDNFDPIQPGWFTSYFGSLPALPRNEFFYTGPGCAAPNGTITGNSMGILTNASTGLFCGYTNTPSGSGYSPIVFHQVNAVGYTGVTVSFLYKCRGENAFGGLILFDYGQLMYSFDGVTWTSLGTLYTNSTGVFSVSGFAMPAAVNNTNFYLGFRFISDFSTVNNPPLIIDNLSVRATCIAAPSFTACPASISTPAVAGTCSKVVTYSATTAGTPAPTVSYTLSGATTGSGSGTGSGSSFNVGVTTVTITASSPCGTATCSFTVTVNDVTPPSLTCPPTQTLVLNGSCAGALGDYRSFATASDACSGVTLTQSPAIGTAVSGVGTTTVTITATDGRGNSTSCNFSVNRRDITPPSLTCPPTQTLVLSAACTGALGDYRSLATTSDGCSAVTRTQSPAPGTAVSGTGTTVVSITSTDASGNATTCSFNVNKVDNTAPALSCPGTQTVVLNSSCSVSLGSYTSMATASDGCSAVTLTQSPATGTVLSGVGSSTVTITATDASGNATSCSFSVDRVDITPPLIAALPAPSTIDCPATPAFATATASDNCSAVTLTFNDVTTAGSCAGNYSVTRTWTATDASGNASTASQTITVQDVTAPLITCPASVTVSCEDPTSTSATGVATATDACSGTLVGYTEVSDLSGCNGTGTITRTWHATDDCGNLSSCVQVITVVDNTAPSITCLADVMLECVAALPAPDPGAVKATDNCDAAPVVAWVGDVTLGGTACSGSPLTIVRTYSATDACGNTSTCTQNLVVEASPLSVDAGANTTVYYGASGYNCADLNANATGGCGPYTYSWSTGATTPGIHVCPTVTTCYHVTITDANGCTSTDEVCVCVVDATCNSRNNNGHGGTGQTGGGLGTVHVTICHTPPASGWQTKCLPISAVADHLGHGDFLGPCSLGGVPACDPMFAPKMAASVEAADAASMTAYPNPFSASTTVQFTLGADEGAVLKVYNLNGVQVATLFDGNAAGGQKMSFEFNPQGLAEGIYMARLVTSSGNVQTLKLVVQR